MNFLFDTNILISREAHTVLSSTLQELGRLINEHSISAYVHPLSVKEIQSDKDKPRREIQLSKIKAYPILDTPPNPTNDAEFITAYPDCSNNNDIVDRNLLYCVYKDVVDFLITEDRKLIRTAELFGLERRVLSVAEATQYLLGYYNKSIPLTSPWVTSEYTYNINIGDKIFDGLRDSYPNFNKWWAME